MSKKELITKVKENWRKYHVPGKGNYTTRPFNAVFISTSNSLKHEQKKLEVCYNLRKKGSHFITEAVENKTGLRRDVVELETDTKYEVECTRKRAERHRGLKNVEVIMA